MSEPGSSNFAIDKISTMSLGEFRNLLNSALAVPNGNTESQCSSDSPRSQGSVDSGRNLIPGKSKKSTPAKSAYSYRSVSASRTQPSKSSVTPSKPGTHSKALDSQGRRYSSTQTSYDKTVRSSTHTTNANCNSTRVGQSSHNSNNVQRSNLRSVQSSGYGQERPKTPNIVPRSRSNASSVSENANASQSNNRATFASRSSSHSSIHSCESTDDGRNSLGTDYGDQGIKVLTPSSVDSDYSFRGSSVTSSDYTRSNSYTPCSAADERLRLEKIHANARASSEPKENISSISKDIQNAYGVPVSKPINVGYVTISYENDDDSKNSNAFDEIENEINRSRHTDDSQVTNMPNNQTSSQTDDLPQTPSGRQTPSFIPRPVTPKLFRKMSLPQNGDASETVHVQHDMNHTTRPPMAKKTNIIARAHGSDGVRSADKSKEQTYREIFQKRSTTPGPGNSTTTDLVTNARRSMTPGPYLSKLSTLRSASATINRTRLNEAIEQNKDPPLSVFNSDDKENANVASASKRNQVIDRKKLMKQKSAEQPDTVIMVNVNRSEGRHSISVQGENESRQSVNKPKVLARARTDDNRARTPTRTAPSTPRQRPQSVDPRQLIPRSNIENKSIVKPDGDKQHGVYDRTQEWVQTAVEQTKVKKPKVRVPYTPKVRRAMTPNSFDMRIDNEHEEPRSLDEIKAALTLPINGLNNINIESIDAPPEDPEMYATMEQLFHELRQQELKNSVNETPGNNPTSSSKAARSKSSKSNSSNNDEDMSLDSNRNIKTKTGSISTNSSSNCTSHSMQRSNRTNDNSNQTSRHHPMSRTSSTSNTGVSQFSENQYTPRKKLVTSANPSGTLTTALSTATRPSTPGPSMTAKRPSSPQTTTQTPPRQASPKVASHPPPPPASPRVSRQPPRPSSPLSSRSASPSTQMTPESSRGSTPNRTLAPRPASTPPRPYSPVVRQRSKSTDELDNVFENEKTSDSGNILKKIKEIIKVNPRKDKAEGINGKSRIPAPKSLSNIGKSRSYSNLSNISHSLSVSSDESNGHAFEEGELNGYGEYVNGGLNASRSETPKLRMNTPLTTGRSSLIRKESMEKNKSTNRLVRTMSVERNMAGLANNYQYYGEGEYV